MVVVPSDISFVYSGGPHNTSPDASLGGEPSSTPLTGNINNLFDDVTQDEARLGLTDYCCIYIFNNNATDTLSNSEICLSSQVAGGSNCKIGVIKRNEIQTIEVTGSPTGGYFILTYEGDTAKINWNADMDIVASRIETRLNAIPSLSGLLVLSDGSPPDVTFTVHFEKGNRCRAHDLLKLKSNHLTGGVTDIAIARVQGGSPINTIAQEITNEIQKPDKVGFKDTDLNNPEPIGDLQHGDGFPLWAQRVTTKGTPALQNDGIVITLIGKP
jgi:hypothetical protein